MATAQEVSFSFFFVLFCSLNMSEKQLVSGDVLLVLALTLLLLSCFPFSSQWDHGVQLQIKEKGELFEVNLHSGASCSHGNC